MMASFIEHCIMLEGGPLQFHQNQGTSVSLTPDWLCCFLASSCDHCCNYHDSGW